MMRLIVEQKAALRGTLRRSEIIDGVLETGTHFTIMLAEGAEFIVLHQPRDPAPMRYLGMVMT